MDPGRRAIEQREAGYLSAGDRILTEHGREYEVLSWTGPDVEDQMEISVRSVHTESVEVLVLSVDQTVRVRVRQSGNDADPGIVQ